jgi:hypothetical protein
MASRLGSKWMVLKKISWTRNFLWKEYQYIKINRLFINWGYAVLAKKEREIFVKIAINIARELLRLKLNNKMKIDSVALVATHANQDFCGGLAYYIKLES